MMNVIKKIKEFLYPLKLLYQRIFLYPKDTIPSHIGEGNDYWQEKRGEWGDLGKISSWQKERADFVLRTISEEHDLTLADIGCGDGAVLKYLKDRADVTRMIGIDMSPYALEKAKGLGIETVQAHIENNNDLAYLPSADHYILFEVLEHVSHSEVLLQKARERSEKGVFFSFPNSGYFPHRLRLLFGRSFMQWRIHPAEHVRFWTVTDLKWWLQAQGFSKYELHCYKGVPVLNRFWPSLFASGMVVFLPKQQ